jgi:hypothetical protein
MRAGKTIAGNWYDIALLWKKQLTRGGPLANPRRGIQMNHGLNAWARKLLLGAASAAALLALPRSAQAEPGAAQAEGSSARKHDKKASHHGGKHAQVHHKAAADKKHEKAADEHKAEAKKPEAKKAAADKKKADARHHHGKTAQVGHHETRREPHVSKQDADAHCLRDAINLGRASGESEHFALTRCNGKPAEHALEKLSVLLRPYSVEKPSTIPLATGHEKGHDLREGEFLPGIRLADAGLLSRIQAVATQYPGKRLTVISGYRPGSSGSFHKSARAADLRVEGVTNDELAAFCRSLVDTGCGYYPNSSFVHIDSRPRGTGHVYWIDASAPGEAPRYVKSWPVDGDDADDKAAAKAGEHAHGDSKKHDAVDNDRPAPRKKGKHDDAQTADDDGGEHGG